ncbi:Crp/Fnr family transcriptional regulator [Acetobacter conturbans]|uniref:Helix-turn-helix domain-containing protein n=1 Tax=Acetobacter conturbans TaxID=1737472 RepID=A0ABX0JYB4_9PROT|nr:Crp/Fnr family transcriptional regulator [Acetobacter conturbans]NHN87445.1 helix-turn-helix domain-containing protein [Acetobacter conturbans]
MQILAGPLPPLHIRAVGDWPADRIDPDGYLLLADEMQKQLALIASQVVYLPKENIFTQATVAKYIYLICKGTVRVSHQLEDGRSQVVAFYNAGDPFGLQESGVYLNSADALTECYLVRVPLEQLHSLCDREPRLQKVFLVGAMAQLRMSQRHLLLVTHQRIIKRIAGFLLECSCQMEGFDARQSVLTLIMDRTDIADYLGTSIETVSRTLGKLEEQKLVRRLDARRLQLDIPGLQRVLQQ